MPETVLDALIIDEWLDTTLRGDTDLFAATEGRIYSEQAPEGAKHYPIVIFNQQSPLRDIRGLGGFTVMSQALYQVKVIGEGVSYLPLRPLASRIHDLLHDKQYIPATSGGMIVTSIREEDIKYPEIEGGKHYRHLGGLYRIQISH